MTETERREAHLIKLGGLIATPEPYLTIHRAMVQCPRCKRCVIDNGDGTPAYHKNEKGVICTIK
jgi:hypothetical protein